MRGFKGGSDDFTLDFLKGTKAGDRTGGARGSRSHIVRKISGFDEVILCCRGATAGMRENHRALESVAEFADIAGPRVGGQHAARRIAQLGIRAGMNGTKYREKMIGEGQDVGAALAKRRNRENEDVQPEIEILAKGAGFYGGGKVYVGESDQARFNAQGFRAAQALKRALLQNAQELALRPGCEGGDFIEHD